ncbi:hypothetical protein NA57DRAFT_43493 [Rhizodiscina lignyota]|uniref:CASTOR ACT domain-containing protein n=1 Tax=Rhizodiscina lignyota TaxID=1504668 RepID=A0A9P4M2N0_9PEZI|nr:hypothetical protein NA57DRAFT_43493 [Rhizodiscina lignyota]
MITEQDTQLALIHIPLHLYHNFLQPILKVLLPTEPAADGDDSPIEHATDVRSRRPWEYEHPFVNISVTPIECSVACSRSLAQRLFVPARDALDAASRSQVSITEEDFVVMQVDGEGLDAGQRVLELTSPLAMARISIFFITTYFSDYILVPLRSRGLVIQALEERGFAFEKQSEAYINPQHNRNTSTPSFDTHPPSTPPPTTVSELQQRTFTTLKKHNVFPTVDPSIQLIQCAGRKNNSDRNGSVPISSPADDKMYLGLVKCLITPPRFLSLTLTDTEPASLLLERSLLHHFACPTPSNPSDSVLLGSKDDILVPIILDLSTMPLESTGIVCGVAGRLVGGTKQQMLGEPENSVEMSYLSTAKAGAVMVAEWELQRAMDALKGMSENGMPMGY